jgi:hypothetical protein
MVATSVMDQIGGKGMSVMKFVVMDSTMGMGFGIILMQISVMMEHKSLEMVAIRLVGRREAGNAEVVLLVSLMYAVQYVQIGGLWVLSIVMMETLDLVMAVAQYAMLSLVWNVLVAIITGEMIVMSFVGMDVTQAISTVMMGMLLVGMAVHQPAH